MTNTAGTEVATRARFDEIRYAQCWEDADVLLAGLDIQPGDTCVGIASAGENCLSMLAKDPARVIAVDLNRSQIACLELRVAAYQALDHAGLLRLIGSRPGDDRGDLYQRCRPLLSDDARAFWDAHAEAIRAGIGGAGKFENYFRLFRDRVLPFVHRRAVVERMLAGGARDARIAFYDRTWNTWRWRLMFRFFFSRRVMGRHGRDPEFFRYVEGSVADRILARTKHALTELDPAANPYLTWVLCGTHREALPFALRPENFDIIRSRLDRITWRLGALEDALDELGDRAVDRFNLSDIFEYMSPAAYEALLARLVRAGRSGGRLAYWNMLAPRRRPESMADRLIPMRELDHRLLQADKAYFYSAFVVETIA
ncbi:MAG: DUF3419 family protein [Planctomycetes bacterium]|nr:DUF3419 family protein [Planctomycetota bacterium]